MECSYRGLFASDLDGTLLDRGVKEFSVSDMRALNRLGDLGYLRVIATGRSPFSFNRMMGKRTLPVDYLVLSSGASIHSYPDAEPLRTMSMALDDARRAVRFLDQLKLDFTVQAGAPDNHRFAYRCNTRWNPDLQRRIELYSGYCHPLGSGIPEEEVTQIVVIVPPAESSRVYRMVCDASGDYYNVVRTTSPLDGASMWIELFPPGVSKSSGISWIASDLGLSPSDSAAVGNDYNDQDMLQWAGAGFVVDQSPHQLRRLYRQVPSAGESGVAEAIRLWLLDRGEIQDGDEWV